MVMEMEMGVGALGMKVRKLAVGPTPGSSAVQGLRLQVEG